MILPKFEFVSLNASNPWPWDWKHNRPVAPPDVDGLKTLRGTSCHHPIIMQIAMIVNNHVYIPLNLKPIWKYSKLNFKLFKSAEQVAFSFFLLLLFRGKKFSNLTKTVQRDRRRRWKLYTDCKQQIKNVLSFWLKWNSNENEGLVIDTDCQLTI